MSVYTSESPETLTDTVQRACVVYEESCPNGLCNMPSMRASRRVTFVSPQRSPGPPKPRHAGSAKGGPRGVLRHRG